MRRRHPGWWLPVAALAAIGVAPSVATAASGACPTLTDGVTVVVDFQGLGGGTVVRCAPGDPASGLAALTGAGFTVDQVQSWPGVVCRIDGAPGDEREDCQDMPPADAYWAYFHADRGGSWRYSSTGPGRYDPDVGSVEGWSFSEGGGATPPRVPPPDEPPPEPEPEPEAEPEPEDEGDAASTGATDAPRPERTAPQPAEPADEPSPGGGATERTRPPVTSALRPDPSFPTAAAPTPPPSSTPTPSASPPPPSEQRALASSEAAGSPAGTVAALALIGSLVAAAGFITRRRREEGTP